MSYWPYDWEKEQEEINNYREDPFIKYVRENHPEEFKRIVEEMREKMREYFREEYKKRNKKIGDIDSIPSGSFYKYKETKPKFYSIKENMFLKNMRENNPEEFKIMIEKLREEYRKENKEFKYKISIDDLEPIDDIPSADFYGNFDYLYIKK